MTDEILNELHQKFTKAISLQRQINDLRKILDTADQIKLWGICIYYDEECNERHYADMPVEDLQRFIDAIVTNRVKVLEQEFADL